MSSRLRISICGVLLFALAGAALAGLPDGWASQDIGDEGLAGSADQAGGVWTVQGSGPDIFGDADDFHFCYTQTAGDTEIIARVIGITDGSDEWARAGVMIRETLADNSNHAFISLTNNTSAGHATAFQWRSVADGNNNHIDDDPAAYTLGDPVWVKIERVGDTMTGYTSMDGVTWSELGSHTNVMASDVYVGLAVTSHDNAEIATGTFDNVLLSGLPCCACQGASGPVPADGSVVGLEVWEDGSAYMILDYTPCADAVSHTAYFSDNEQDVIDRDPAHSLGNPPWPAFSDTAFVIGYDDPHIPEYARAPLVFGTAYYWCIDTWSGEQDIPGPTWSFTVIDDRTWGPSPADGEQLVLPNGTMTWNPRGVDVGNKILSYDVYIGMDQTAVSNATTDSPEYAANVLPESYDYSDLEPNTEYFWRVDTVLGLTRPPFTKTYFAGEVWSFTTLPKGRGGILREWWAGIPGSWISDLTNDPNYPDNPDGSEIIYSFEGPTNIMDNYGSRLHGWLWVAQTGEYTFAIGAAHAAELWLSTDSKPANASLIAYAISRIGPFPWDEYPEQVSEPIALEAGKTYYISALMKAGIGNDYIGVAWRGPVTGGDWEVIEGRYLMPYSPIIAEDPSPPDRSEEIPLDATLSWTPGIDYSTGSPYTVQHVYAGTDRLAVANATTDSPEYMGNPTGPNKYGPLNLSYDDEIYWRVDGEVEDSGSVLSPGDLWSFTTVNWLSVDDMETYTPWVYNNIFLTWKDGYGDCDKTGNDTGAILNENREIVHSGLQSMQYEYDNDGTVYSPCTMEQEPRPHFYSKTEAQVADWQIAIGSDWTTGGVRALSMQFYGEPENDINEPLWVQLQDSTKALGQKVFYGEYPGEDINDINEPEWHEWFIDLADFAVDLNDVVSIAIGIGSEGSQTPGGSGTLYFDDIRLYTPRCIPQRRTPAFAKLDQAPQQNPDCKIDCKDLEIMAQNWLKPPETANLRDYAELIKNWLKTQPWPF